MIDFAMRVYAFFYLAQVTLVCSIVGLFMLLFAHDGIVAARSKPRENRADVSRNGP
jgi:hypothetical protein